ncbi:MAG: major capsid protein [Tannerellaceae bacterium]
MPDRSDMHIDKALTNISVQYLQDPANYIAGQVFPMVPVKKQSDRYFVYLRDDWFRDEAQERAPGTESAGGDYDIDNSPTYFCRKFAYHKDVVEEDRANADDPLTPDEDAVSFVTDKLLLNKENKWAKTFFKNGVWSFDYAGGASGTTPDFIYWDDYSNSNPIEDITKFATEQSERTGKRPNTMVMGRKAYDSLKNHPDFLDRVKYTQKGVVTSDLIAEMFDVERVLVANAIQNTAERGKTADMSFIMGNHVLLCYTTNAPKLKTATAGYTFVWTGLMGANAFGGRINRFRMPALGIGTERIECELAYDMKVVAADMGTFLKNAVAP